MKKIFTLALSLIFAFSSITTASAEQLKVNETEFTIYALQDGFQDYIVIPDEYPTSAQIITSQEGCTFNLIDGSATIDIDKNGKITVGSETSYVYNMGGYSMTTTFPMEGESPTSIIERKWFGTNVYRVSNGNSKVDVTVNLVDYVDINGEKKIEEYLNEFNLESMTDLEKLEIACKYAASFDYGTNASSAYTMIALGSGDCWASTDVIVKICKKLGIKAWSRKDYDRSNPYNRHTNAMAEIDGKYYVAEAGYSMPAPRAYNITERSTLFSYTNVDGGIEVYQYDGETEPEVLEIPAEIDGKKVVSIGSDFYTLKYVTTEIILPETIKKINKSAFNSCYELKKFNIPASVEFIGAFAFTACNKLTEFTCDKNNQYYTVIDNVLFDKDVTKLISAPTCSKNYILPDTVEIISQYAFYHNYGVKTITLNESLTEIEEGGIGDCSSLTQVKINGGKLKTLQKFAICNNKDLKSIVIPQTVETIGEYAVGYYNWQVIDNFIIYGEPDSAIEKYANENNITFIDVNNIPETTTTTTSTTTATITTTAKPTTTNQSIITTSTTQLNTTTPATTTTSTTIPKPTSTTTTEPISTTTKSTTAITQPTTTQLPPTTTTTQLTTTNGALKGDVNADGKVSVADARKIVVAISVNMQNYLIDLGDVNCDGKVSVADARKIVVAIAKNDFNF